MTGLRSRWRGFVSNDDGIVALIFALTLPVLAGVTAFAVDIMHGFTTKQHLLTVAEAAATAGASRLPDRDLAREAALGYAQLNYKGMAPGQLVTDPEIEIGYWHPGTRTFTPTAQGGNAVRVTASRAEAKGNGLPTFFGRILKADFFELSATAIAKRVDGFPCIMALAPTGTGIKLDPNARVETETCEVHAHSSDSRALDAAAEALVAATYSRICIKGGYRAHKNASIDPTPETGCTPAEDRFADVPAPSFGGCTHTNTVVSGGSPVTLYPGVYCGGLKITVGAQVTFSPGEYIIKDGPLTMDPNTTATGHGVGFYLTGDDGLLDISNNTLITLSAPTTGPLLGMLVFQDRNFGGVHAFGAGASSATDGVVYLPNGALHLNSNAQLGGASDCLQIIAYRIEFESFGVVDMVPDYSMCAMPPNVRQTSVVG